MSSEFEKLGISTEILKSLDDMGFVEPTLVQQKSIPVILSKKDVVVMSKTGSGKTAVFGVPLLQLIDNEKTGPHALILTPTRELAVQVDNDMQLISKYSNHKTAVVYGQHSISEEMKTLKKNISIISGTPGRVFDHIEQRNIKTSNIRYLVLDEADRMLDMGFLPQVIRILKNLPEDRMTLLFSATIPDEVQKISRNFMKDPVFIEIESPTMTVDTINQAYYRVTDNEKYVVLEKILSHERPDTCLIFCNTRRAVDRLKKRMDSKHFRAGTLHGDIPQAKRTKTIDSFKKGEFNILIATDVAARGLHIENLSLVINYDLPIEKDSYVHRIGRTGRAGKDGRAISLVTVEDIITLYEIEEHIGVMIEEKTVPTAIYTKHKKISPVTKLQKSVAARPAKKVSPVTMQQKNESVTPAKKTSPVTRPQKSETSTPVKKISSHAIKQPDISSPPANRQGVVIRRAKSTGKPHFEPAKDVLITKDDKQPLFKKIIKKISKK